MLELNELHAKNLIENSAICVIKAYADNCPACVNYAPVFEQGQAALPEIPFGQIKVSRTNPTDFTRNYMQAGADVNGIGTPMTFVFKDGALAYRYYGALTLAELMNFISTGKTILPDDEVKAARIAEIDAMVGRSMRETNEQIAALTQAHQQLVRECEAEITRIRSA